MDSDALYICFLKLLACLAIIGISGKLAQETAKPNSILDSKKALCTEYYKENPEYVLICKKDLNFNQLLSNIYDKTH